VCGHLRELDNYIKSKNVKELFRGKAWSENCNEWVYYDCILNIEKLRRKFSFADCVKTHEYYDMKTANESGFYCNTCKDGIMGFASINEKSQAKIVVE
jgi:hypothetical protein